MIETLPVELIGRILGELDLSDLIKTAQLSRRLRLVASDTTINPWRLPILRNLLSEQYEDAFKNLSVYTTVPRHNWVEILSMGKAPYLLFETTLPNLKHSEWEQSFRIRFLPSFQRKAPTESWKAVFLRVLHQTWHRSCTFCTTNESSTKYIVLNRNGSANLLQVSSRNFNPLVVLNDMRRVAQHNMHHLEVRVRLVVQFADVRILALGTLNRPRSPLTVNANAKIFLHPPGIEFDHNSYSRQRYPLPAQMHAEYPFITPGGGDRRWITSEGSEEGGLQWVGGLMVVAQIRGPDVSAYPALDEELIVGPGRQHYASFTWEDLFTIAPWLKDSVTKQIDGPGLGND
ncbi:hypothetical protein FB45DRAFT_739716 [Roridomyces roridus]|uniref:F-box domain-containing protein n=1 Tax=Roridomyces roridus TaxID=1738132 RepID=A0AAD7C575_9AGAR|nr:hypothetical protein FB45DRAFT_739716 [Roridomyces roridus]